VEAWNKQQRQEFGLRLRKARVLKKMTQTEVGAMFDVGKAAVSAWEVGSNTPSAEQLARMADEFGASVEWLLFGVEGEPFSIELRRVLSSMSAEMLRRIENSVRGQLDMPPRAQSTQSVCAFE
jgi:transcriptional regulator with XRE-family HTH domain